MLTIDAALDRLDSLLTLARRSGADAAEAIYGGEGSTSIGVRLGALEDVGRSEGEELSIRVFRGNRSAHVSISDLSDAAQREAVERALAMAADAPEDPFAGLAGPELLASGPYPDFDLFDPMVEALSADRLREMALEAEDSARSLPRISNSEGGSASAGSSIWALATSNGFRGGTSATSVSVSAVVVAGEGGGMQRDYHWHHCRHLEDLENPAEIGRTAAERTVRRLSPQRAPTGPMPVLFDPRVSASLIGHLLGAISGSSIARKTSFILGHEDEQLFAPAIHIREDPHLIRGLRSRSFDGEGLPTSARNIIDGGRLTGWLIDCAAGRQLGLAPTGHASRGSATPPGVSPSNLWLEPGTATPEQLMEGIQTGLYVTELIGMGVNGLTGDYSRGTGGFLIRDGQLAEPVSEATIAGNLLDMYKALVPANDLKRRHGMDAPTIRIDGMTVAGG